MFTHFESSRRAISTFITMASASVKSRYTVITTLLAVLLLGVAQPAQAAIQDPPVADPVKPPDFMCYIGAPALDFLDPAKSQVRTITGYAIGVLLLVGGIFMIVAGLRMVLAGRSAAKAADGFVQAKNVIAGIVVALLGLIALSLLVTVLVAMVAFQNC